MTLKLSGISFSYAAGTPMEQRALSAISLDVAAGNMTLVLGPTGSGKSTLLRIAAGLLAPLSGTVTVDGSKAAGAVTAREGGVGLVFQSPETQLFAETLLDDVAFGPRNQGLDAVAARAVAIEALRQVGLDPDIFSDRSPFGLSGGEARRAALAGVLAMRPRYLLLDEPTAGLDAFGRADVLRVLRSVRESGTGVLVVTHDAEEFLGRADDVLLLHEGSAAYSGPTSELIDGPELFTNAGLRPPPVLDVLDRARRAGMEIGAMTLDPERAAEMLATAGGVAS